jgi:XTP/dITP diphosphohydrolase
MKPSSVPEPRSLSRRRLIVATGNAGKLREIRALLAGLPLDVVGQAELGIGSPEETGSSFASNALLKARHAARASGAAAIADDSGLEVDALEGAPGIRSARYAGAGADDAANNAKLLAALAGLPLAERRARYRCAAAFVGGPLEVAPLLVEAAWEGFVIEEPRGTGGFGYDPYFWLPELELTAAQLDLQQKNSLSHRGKALRALRVLLEARV